MIEGQLKTNQSNMSHLRVLGSMCFRHVPEQTRKELGDRSKVLVLIGYPSIDSYKLYSPIEGELVISKDGLVNESKRWDWSQNCVRRR